VEALADFRSRPQDFDVLMTDNSMVHMSGLMLAKEVLRVRPGFPIILVSGASPGLDPELLRESGISRLLGKPCTTREMDRAIRSLLDPAGGPGGA